MLSLGQAQIVVPKIFQLAGMKLPRPKYLLSNRSFHGRFHRRRCEELAAAVLSATRRDKEAPREALTLSGLVVRKSATIHDMSASRDRALLARMNSLLFLSCRPTLPPPAWSCPLSRLHKSLHATSGTRNQLESRFYWVLLSDSVRPSSSRFPADVQRCWSVGILHCLGSRLSRCQSCLTHEAQRNLFQTDVTRQIACYREDATQINNRLFWVLLSERVRPSSSCFTAKIKHCWSSRILALFSILCNEDTL